MNFKIIKALYKKEILDVLRDKKTVLMMLVVPLVLYPLLIVFGLQLMTKISTDMEEQNYKIGMDFEEKKLTGLFEAEDKDVEGYSISLVKTDEPKDALAKGELDAYVTKEVVDGEETFVVCYLSADTNSSYAADIIIEVLNEYSLSITTDLIEDAGLDAEYVLNPISLAARDYSSNEESAGNIMGSLVPFMLVTSLLMGTMYPAIDTTAGERERGTLETVLTLPVTNQELFFSKFLTVATIGIASAILNIISMGGVGVYMYKTMLGFSGGNGIDMGQFVPGIIICGLCVLAFAVFISAISMCVCVFAKSYKEANNYITPLTLVVMFASMVSIVPNVELTSNMALVPVVNICLLIRDLLVFKFNITVIMLVLVSNIIYGMLAVVLLGRIYNSEAILFGDGSASVQIFEKRSNMIKGGVPTLGDMWLVLAISLVAMIYVGGAVQIEFGYYGVLGTQFIILLVPILYALYTKKSLLETFRLRMCKANAFIGGLLMIVGTILLGMIVTGIAGMIFKNSATELTESMEYLLGDSFIKTLLVVAVAPAICEELMFRGFVFSSLEKKCSYKKAIVIGGVLFGAYHMNIVQFFTTAFIGMVICYVSYRSKSIFPGMLMHFFNNALSCLTMYYPDTVKKVAPILVSETVTLNDMVLMVLVGLALIYSGAYILNMKKVEKN